MNHPGDSLLAELAQGSLEGAAQEEVEEHVSQCPICRSMLAQLLKAFVPDPRDEPRAAAGPQKGLIVGRYVVLEPIGAGALGEVFAAYDTTLERTVALKWLYPAVRDADRPLQRERLIFEARALAKVQHPNVVAVHDVIVQGAGDVLVMELVARAKSLRESGSTRPWRQTVKMFLDAGAGLAAAHAAQVVHRDFKPDNVLIDEGGRVRVADFGLARANEPSFEGDGASTRSTLSGTPAYLAPERWQGDAASPLSDQFSFCASLYECLSGKLAFEERAAGQRLEAMKRGPARLTVIPQAVEKVIRRGLAFDAADRWPSMERLTSALSSTLHRNEKQRAGCALIAVAAITLGSAALAWRQSARRCENASAPVSAAWNDSHRDGVRKAFLATAHPAAEDLSRRVIASLDSLALQLGALRVTACEATARQGESEAAHALRDGCLARRVNDFGALAAIFEVADTKVVERAVGALEQLPSAGECLDVSARASIEPMPAALEARHKIDAAAGNVSRVRALRLAGKTKESAALGQATVAEARAVGWRPLTAEALVEWSNGLERLMKVDQARAVYLEALQLALATNDFAQAYAAAVGLAYVDGVDSPRVQAGEAWVVLAKDLIEPASLKQTNEALRVSNVEGLIQVKTQRPAEAAKTFADLAAQLEAIGQQHTMNYARVLQNANGPLREIGQAGKALELSKQSLKIMEEVLSPNHPDVAAALNNIGSALADIKQYDEAEPYYRSCIALRTRLYGPDALVLATPFYNLGELAYRRGDGAASLRDYGASRALVEKARGPDDDDVFDSRMGEGLALGLLGRFPESLATLEAVLPELQKRALPPWNVAQAKLGIAASLRALHRDEPRVAALALEVSRLEGERHAEQREQAAALLGHR